jgi:sugar lactone lactonase YvrE
MMNRTSFSHEISPDDVVMTCVAETASIVGESPVWSTTEHCLYFVDIPQRLIHRYAPQVAKVESFEAPEIVTAVAPRQSGGLIVSLERSLATFDATTGKFSPLTQMSGEPFGNRFNDGKCDPQGRFWAGTMSKDLWDAPLGTLYRFDHDAQPTAIIGNVRCSNGLGWSPDGRTFYFVESFAYTIRAYDFEPTSGTIQNGRVFATLDPASGAFPDGLTVDAEGGVWNAQPVFGRVVRYDPAGAIDRIVETPVSRCTSCTFGGDDLGTMFLTSARDSLSPQQLLEEPLAGGLFAFRPGVSGITSAPFLG